MADLFDAEAMYDEDYLHFFAGPAGPSVRAPGISAGSDDPTAELVWRLLDLRPGMRVLDLACGHGSLANRLAARGCLVTGLDRSAVFLDRARADAAALGVDAWARSSRRGFSRARGRTGWPIVTGWTR